jgi:hypothetical protein
MMELEEGWGAVAAVPEPVPRPRVPWEDPELSGPVGFFRTLWDVLFRPGEFFENLGREGWAEPLAFALIVSSAGLLCALFWHLLILAPAGLNPEDAAGLSSYLDLGASGLLAVMVGSPVLVLIDLGVGGLCWWGSVSLVGASRDFRPAWRIFCYAHGGLALAAIPFFGLLVAGIWILVLMYVGMKQVYGISTWGALGALAVFLSLQALLGLILLVGLMAALALLGFLLLLG